MTTKRVLFGFFDFTSNIFLKHNLVNCPIAKNPVNCEHPIRSGQYFLDRASAYSNTSL